MSEVIEVEGKTIDEAIEKACLKFDLPREKLNIEILSEETSGFLGLGSRKALIRASVMSIAVDFSDSFEGGKRKQHRRGEIGEGKMDTRAQRGREVLEGILRLMDVDFPITVEQQEEYAVLSIHGDGSGLLIGKGGQTLDALQYIVNKAASRDVSEGQRLILDTENYREKRKQSLVALAQKLSEKAKRLRKPVVVNPMNAHDRRIIHLALQNDKEVTTKSRGEGAYRKIVIVPSRKNQG